MSSALWRRLSLPLMVLAWCTLGSSLLFAQNIQYTENKPDLALRSETRVDPSTLGMSISIPLASYPGRAGMGLPVALTYSSKVLRLDYRNTDSPPITNKVVWTGVEFAEHSTAGWTSTLGSPRVEFTGMGQYYNYEGRPADEECVTGQCVVGDHYIKRIDVHMPEMDGFETARRLTEAHPGCVVVLVSLNALELPDSAVTACGAVAFLRKEKLRPTTLRELWIRHGLRG